MDRRVVLVCVCVRERERERKAHVASGFSSVWFLLKRMYYMSRAEKKLPQFHCTKSHQHDLHTRMRARSLYSRAQTCFDIRT